MSSRPATARHRFRSWLTPGQRRGIRVLAWASVISLAGVSLTGIWQFFAHEDNPSWYAFESGDPVRGVSPASTGVADWHGTFATTTGVVALFGGAWFAYKVLYDIPWSAVLAFVVALFGVISGSVIRFNLVKLDEREYSESGRGYAQVFGGDLEFVVTSRFEMAPLAIRLWTLGHVLTVPILLALIWFGLPRSDDAET